MSPAVTLYVEVPAPEDAPTLQRRSVLVTSSTGLLLFVFWRTYSYASVTVPSGAMKEVKRSVGDQHNGIKNTWKYTQCARAG